MLILDLQNADKCQKNGCRDARKNARQCRCTDNIDVEAQIYRAVADAATDAVHDFRNTEIVDVVRGDKLEPDVLVVFEVDHTLLAMICMHILSVGGEQTVRQCKKLRTASLHRIPACTLELRMSFSSCATLKNVP